MGVKTRKLGNINNQIVEWQSVHVSDGSTALTTVAGRGYFINTTSNACTVTLPASPDVGDQVILLDYARTWDTNAVTIDSNGNNFQGDDDTYTVDYDTEGQGINIVYADSTKGWIPNSDIANALTPAAPATQKGIFAYGYGASSVVSLSNLINSSGVIASDVTGVGTARSGVAGATYGLDKGIFGFGFSANSNLDIMNLVVLAIAGIVVKIFFEENHTKLGTSGPASTTIWGYGLTAISLVLMIFMAIYLTSTSTKQKEKLLLERGSKETSIFSYYISILSSGAIPVILTLGIVVYIIILNFMYFTRINSNKVSSSYSVYSFFSSLLVIIQIGIIIKYMYSILSGIQTKTNDTNEKQNKQSILKGLSLIVTTINYIFVLILHILLAFFSTDG